MNFDILAFRGVTVDAFYRETEKLIVPLFIYKLNYSISSLLAAAPF